MVEGLERRDDEADRVWRAIEADRSDLQTLYEAGLERRERAGAFERMIRALTMDPRGQTPIGLARRRRSRSGRRRRAR